MQIAEAQREVRTVFLGGFVGQAVSSAVWLVSAATIGYARAPLGWAARGYSAVAGLFLMLPAESFGAARWLNIAGAVMAIALLLRSRNQGRTPVSAPKGADLS